MAQTAAVTTPLGLEVLETNATGQIARSNTNLYRQELLIQSSVLSILATPPSSPSTGDRHIIDTGATGVWAGKTGLLAGWYNAAWVYSGTPQIRWRRWVESVSRWYSYSGSAWVVEDVGVAVAPSWPSVTKTATFTVSATETAVYLIDATSGNITVNLPAVAGVTSRTWYLARIDSSGNTVTIDPNSSELIAGASTKTIAAFASARIYAGASAWYLLSQ